jgi:anti-sigma regulatory factor (Ser/Thr protein kinase)
LPNIEVDLPSRPESAAIARQAVGDELHGRVEHQVLAKLGLLLTELVTNGVKHADGDSVRVEVSLAPDRVRADVIDGGAGFTPPPDPVQTLRTFGWGLVLVRRMADRWGVDRDRVWIELERPPGHVAG